MKPVFRVKGDKANLMPVQTRNPVDVSRISNVSVNRTSEVRFTNTIAGPSTLFSKAIQKI